MEDKKEQHVIPEHKEDGKKHDHYHGEHHFDSQGNHDDILDEDFNLKNSIYTSKRNLIFRITAAGTFLALATIGSAIDYFSERFFKLPINDILLSIRYFDILIICLSIATIGPIFSSFIGFIMPWIHFLIDGDHPVLSNLVDSFGYFLVVWILWFFYYFIFRNSYVHKDKSRKKDLFKRYMPLVGFIPVSVIAYTAFTILIIYVTDQSGHHHDDHADESFINKIINLAEEHHHEHEALGDEWELFKQKAMTYVWIIAGFELVRFSICGALFVILEPQMKKINHRYR